MARDFNGSTDRIDYTNPLNLVGGNSTVSMLVNFDTMATAERYLGVFHNSADSAYVIRWQLRDVSATQFRFRLFCSGATELIAKSNYYTIADFTGGWHHFLTTWDGSITAANVHLYIDGAECTYSQQQNGASLNAPTGKFSVCGQIPSDYANTDGKIAEVGIWSRILTGTEITNLAAFYTPDNYTTNLEFYASMNGGYTDAYGHSATADGTSDYTHPTVYPPPAAGGQPRLQRGILVPGMRLWQPSRFGG